MEHSDLMEQLTDEYTEAAIDRLEGLTSRETKEVLEELFWNIQVVLIDKIREAIEKKYE